VVVTIDNPPVNTSTAAVRGALLAAIRAVPHDAAAVVLVGAGRQFLSGSDLREFDHDELPEPQLPEVIEAIEQLAVPVVAALTGTVLGGGFELALGCDARVATATTIIGLPEVSLGMIPGAGGTQRLPRLVGRARALDLIASSSRIDAAAAAELGIVDTVVTGDLRAAAIEFSRGLVGKRRLMDEPIPDVNQPLDLVRWSSPAAPGSPLAEAIAAVSRCGTDSSAALRAERAAFDRLRRTEEARALRRALLAELAAARKQRDMLRTSTGVVTRP
jgi:3-hydroxyacyl-CoA dehydrogenase